MRPALDCRLRLLISPQAAPACCSAISSQRAGASARARLASTCSVINSLNSNAPPILPSAMRQGFIDHRTQSVSPSWRGKESSS